MKKMNVEEAPRASEQSKEADPHSKPSLSKYWDGHRESNSAYLPSPFQFEIAAMSFADFVETTNIEELLQRDFDKQFNGTRQFTAQYRNFGLNEYDRLRKRPDKWHKNSLKELQYKICKCKWKKTFVENVTQTDATDEVLDKEIQCSLLDFNVDKSTETELQNVQDIGIQCSWKDISQSEPVSLTMEYNSEPHFIETQLDMAQKPELYALDNIRQIEPDVTANIRMADAKEQAAITNNESFVAEAQQTIAESSYDINRDDTDAEHSVASEVESKQPTYGRLVKLVDETGVIIDDSTEMDHDNSFNAVIHTADENKKPNTTVAVDCARRAKHAKQKKHSIRNGLGSILKEMNQQMQGKLPNMNILNQKLCSLQSQLN